MIPGLEEETQTLKIRLLPGPPHSLHVTPEDTQEVENGNPVQFEVELRDVAGNLTTEHKKNAICTVNTFPAWENYLCRAKTHPLVFGLLDRRRELERTCIEQLCGSKQHSAGMKTAYLFWKVPICCTQLPVGRSIENVS